MIYLDSAASTQIDSRVVDLITKTLSESYANCSSIHHFGRQCADLLDKARLDVAQALQVQDYEIIFTSGATEANNLFFHFLSDIAKIADRRVVLVSAIEHKSVLVAAEKLKDYGLDVRKIPVDREGVILLDELRAICSTGSVLALSVMCANNETGVLQPLHEVYNLCENYDILLHSDYAQGLGVVPFKDDEKKPHFASFSGHKIYGPKGVGCLYVKGGAKDFLSPMIMGGAQEFGLRAGTENLPLILGFVKAVELRLSEANQINEHLFRLRKLFLDELIESSVLFQLNTSLANSLPGILNLTFHGIDSDALITSLPGIAFSNGSACNSRAISPSHVLSAMGLDRDRAFNAVRISFGKFNTVEDARIAARTIATRVLSMSSTSSSQLTS